MATPRFDEIDGEKVTAPSFEDIEGEELREDFSDAGASARAPGPESVASEPYGPAPGPPPEPMEILGVRFPTQEQARGAVASFLQGSTFNFADEMAGLQARQDSALRSALGPTRSMDELAKLQPRIAELVSGGMNPQDAAQQAALEAEDGAYTEGRDAFRATEARFREENPKTAFGLTVAGALGAPAPGSGAPAWGTRVAGATGTGALAGAGASEEQEDMAFGAALGAPVGAAAQSFGEAAGTFLGGLAGRGSGWLQEFLSSAAEGRAMKAATGQNRRAITAMVNKGLADADTGTVEVIGRDLLDTGTVTAGASTREIMERAAEGVEVAGRGIGDALDELDAITPQGLRLSADEVADTAEEQLILPLLQGTHGQKQLAQRLMPEIDALRAQGTGAGGGVTLATLEQFKRGLDDAIGPGGWTATEPRPVTEALRRLRGIVNEAIETRAQQISRQTGSDAAERYLANKRLYGSMRTARDVSRDQVSGQISNRLVSVTDYASGPSGILLAGMASGGDPLMSAAGGAAAAGANKLLRERGNQVAAAGLDRLAGSDWLDELARTNPEALGQWGAYLGAAASRSPEALAAAKYELGQTDPAYQEERRRQGGQQQ